MKEPFKPITKEDICIADGIQGCTTFNLSNAKDLEEAQKILKKQYVAYAKLVSAARGFKAEITSKAKQTYQEGLTIENAVTALYRWFPIIRDEDEKNETIQRNE